MNPASAAMRRNPLTACEALYVAAVVEHYGVIVVDGGPCGASLADRLAAVTRRAASRTRRRRA